MSQPTDHRGEPLWNLLLDPLESQPKFSLTIAHWRLPDTSAFAMSWYDNHGIYGLDR
ncbi:hypothetical protein CHELA20_11034 [Hyphomicrobiales bacterium]|nr:hypothetical protein CHELA20_11034 [Hyphomicrobiales bacterium]CAH1694697.1 hypothetical protein CHELA41_51265 [Hyphomicrobiales bacterium]